MSSNLFKGIIENYFKRNGGWLRLKGELSVYYWPRIAGPEIAAKVEATHFRDGYLYLKTENSALAHQISLLNSDILKKIEKLIGKGIIRGVRIKIGTIESRTGDSEKAPEVELNEETKELIEKCSQNIQDPQLAACFSLLMKQTYQLRAKIAVYGGIQCRRCGIMVEKGFEYCPCCERQINEEKQAYLQYLKKIGNDGLISK